MLAIDKLKEKYISEYQLAELLNVDTKRIRDLRSYHVQGKIEFINHIKPSNKSVLYRLEDVEKWLEHLTVLSFGINANDPEA